MPGGQENLECSFPSSRVKGLRFKWCLRGIEGLNMGQYYFLMVCMGIMQTCWKDILSSLTRKAPGSLGFRIYGSGLKF